MKNFINKRRNSGHGKVTETVGPTVAKCAHIHENTQTSEIYFDEHPQNRLLLRSQEVMLAFLAQIKMLKVVEVSLSVRVLR